MRALLERLRGGRRLSHEATAAASGTPPDPGTPVVGGIEITLEEVLALLRTSHKDPFEVQFLAREVRRLEASEGDSAELRGRLEELVARRLRLIGALGEGTPVRLAL